MHKIFLDPGHGGNDPGALGNGLKEKDINLSVALKVGDILRKHDVGVIYSKSTDVFIELSDRAKKANTLQADIFVSLHCNAFTDTNVQGVEIYHFASSTKGKELATSIQNSILTDKLYTKNRGVKTANLAVLRQTNMPSVLVEMGFITNKADSEILKNKQDEMANAIARGILNYLGVKTAADPQEQGLPIMSKTKVTIGQMQEWAKSKNANQLFIDLAPKFYEVANSAGVNPLVVYAQSAKETGYMRFGGVLNASFKNPCGLKINAGGGDKDPNAHHRFKDWQEGIRAQVDHLALYAGATGYPRATSPDPRHFKFIVSTAKTVEELGGKWAPGASYGHDIVKMVKEIERTIVQSASGAGRIVINFLDKQCQIKAKMHNNVTFVRVGEYDVTLRSVFEGMGFNVGYDDATKMIMITA